MDKIIEGRSKRPTEALTALKNIHEQKVILISPSFIGHFMQKIDRFFQKRT
jgi:hypothetical protein